MLCLLVRCSMMAKDRQTDDTRKWRSDAFNRDTPHDTSTYVFFPRFFFAVFVYERDARACHRVGTNVYAFPEEKIVVSGLAERYPRYLLSEIGGSRCDG